MNIRKNITRESKQNNQPSGDSLRQFNEINIYM